MLNLFNKKNLRGLAEIIVVLGILINPGMIRQVDAKGGYNRSLPLTTGSKQEALSLIQSNVALVQPTATWKYFDKGVLPATNWMTNSYSDSAWASGPALLGYGNGGEATIVSYGSNSSSKYVTTYFRESFSISDPASVTGLTLNLTKDDGAVVYLNGKEVYRSNMPTGTVGYSTYASTCSGAVTTTQVSPANLIAGTNVLAIEVHQCSASSSDLAFQADLTAAVTAPTATPVPPTATNTPPPPTATTAPTLPPPTVTLVPTSTSTGGSNVLVPDNATWKFFDKGSLPASDWMSSIYNDSTWTAGPALLGYGNGGETTVVSYGSDANHKYITTYFRSAFNVTDPSQISSLAMNLTKDDGAIVYLNGQEVYRANMPSGAAAYSTYASTCDEQTVTANINPASLVAGTNILAVEVHQCTAYSSDLAFKTYLASVLKSTAPTPTPTVAPTQPPSTATPTQPPTTGHSFYAAANGSSSGDGSLSRPWDLKTALAGPASVKPGDTIWVRGGLYNYRSLSNLYSYIHGSSGLPITIRAYPGERATIDASITIQGAWVTFWGFEMIDSTTSRTGPDRKDAFAAWQPNVQLINNVIHDAGGTGFWWQSENSEMYGNVIYNNGYMGTDRGHGHGIYTTNNTGLKKISDNVVFNNFSGINFHAYSEKTYLNNFLFEGNVSFNGHFLVGGLIPASNVTLKNNFMYRGFTRMGYSTSVTNQGLTMSGNIFDGEGEYSLELRNWNNFSITNNQFRDKGSKAAVLTTPSGGHSTYTWNNSKYFADASSPFVYNGANETLSQWRSATALDSSSTLTASMPTGQQIFVRPNKYELGRGNVIIYNWSRSSSVTVDISSLGLKVGDNYVVHNAQNYYAETIKGTYNGSPITLPMTGWTIAKPLGWSSVLKPVTFPEFGVFVIARY